MRWLGLVVVLGGCGAAPPTPVAVDGATAETPSPPTLRRPFPPAATGDRWLRGISYGPYRQGQRPGGPEPSEAQLREDLELLAPRWQMLRVYSSRGSTEAILRIIHDEDLPLVVMVGAWIAPDAPGENATEVAEAIRLATTFPDEVVAVSVGNETQVSWSAHRSPSGPLIEHLRTVRNAVAQPVTTADDYNFWNKPEAQAVAAECDFVLTHAYAMWNGKSLDESVAWTAETVASIQRAHPELPVVLGETGWATELNEEGDEVEHIHAPAGQAEQAQFYTAFTTWAAEAELPYFYFEAFDEPWKGGDDPRDVEKHWGLYRVDRTPKLALEATP